MSLLDWELPEERRSLRRALDDMCIRSATSLPQTLVDAGIPWIGTAESAGGSGGDIFDAAIALQTLSGHAADVIGVDTGFVASWALSIGGLSSDRSLIAVAADPRNSLISSRSSSGEFLISGTAFDVPTNERIQFLLVLIDQELALIPFTACTVHQGENLAGEPRATVVLTNVTVTNHVAVESNFTQIDLLARLALARSVQISGALSQIRDLTVNYARTREQFGKPIADQQVIAHKLVEICELTLMSQAAVATALDAPTIQNCAIAKSVTGRCARKASMAAHQVHGAMGMSQEYRLGALTTRLWSWTEEAGRPEFWNHYLGQEFLTQPKTSLWESIVNGMKGSNT
jgi:acyl-CoA dehydrogenase